MMRRISIANGRRIMKAIKASIAMMMMRIITTIIRRMKRIAPKMLSGIYVDKK